jgi:multiple sugar transport system substrate-binding protein
MKKLITLFLALILVVSMFAACNTPEGPAGESTPPKGNGDATPAPGGSEGGDEQPETNEHEAIGLPEDINLGGKVITVHHWDAGYPEFEVDQDSLDGDPVADAAYKKNLYTEQLLNVELEFYDWEYKGNGIGQLIEACDNLKNAMSDASSSVDIIANYPRVVPTGAIRGLCYDITSLDSVDLSKEWWPQNLQNEIAVFDSVMFLSGDISTSLIYQIYGLFYNKTLAESFGLENIVQLVDDGEWTLDKFIEITKVGYEDIDTVSGKSEGDTFALTLEWWNADALVQSCGYKILENTAEGIKVTDAFFSPAFGEFVGKIGKWFASDYVFDDAQYAAAATNAFLESRSIFYLGALSKGHNLQDTDIDYGIVPLPKMTTSDSYVTTVANGMTMYSIGRLTKNAEDAGTVLQTLGYYGLQYTTPAVFEVTMQGKFSKDEETMRLLTTLKNGVQFDLALLYQRQIDSINDIPTQAFLRNSEWSVIMSSRQQKLLNKMVDALNEDIKENLGL